MGDVGGAGTPAVHMRCTRMHVVHFLRPTLFYQLPKMALSGFALQQDRYVALLEKLIGESEFLQDNPPKFVPQENRYELLLS